MANKLYLSGPITGYKHLNRPAFQEAKQQLELRAYEVINPHDLITPIQQKQNNYNLFMRIDLRAMLALDVRGIALLPGWSQSKGAKIEKDLAQTLGMPVLPWNYWSAGEMDHLYFNNYAAAVEHVIARLYHVSIEDIVLTNRQGVPYEQAALHLLKILHQYGGYTQAQIGRRYHKSANTICRALQRYQSIPSRVNEKLDRAAAIAEIAEALIDYSLHPAKAA